jgi:hypothetical protein
MQTKFFLVLAVALLATAGIDYSWSSDWGVNLQLPYIARSRETTALPSTVRTVACPTPRARVTQGHRPVHGFGGRAQLRRSVRRETAHQEHQAEFQRWFRRRGAAWSWFAARHRHDRCLPGGIQVWLAVAELGLSCPGDGTTAI